MELRSIFPAFAAVLCAAIPAFATDLATNLASSSGGAELASGPQEIAASFKTDGSAHALTSVTLLMYQSVAGSASVQIYKDGGLEPGTLVATLVAPVSIPGSLSSVEFTATSLTLSANTTYWVVLSARSGQFGWSWADSTNGSGAGYVGSWGISPDGSAWWTQANLPLQMKVVVDACTAAAIASEPSSARVCPGGSASFTVGATGTGLTFQWRKGVTALTNGGHFANVNGPTLMVSPATAVDGGAYSCMVTGSCGNAVSQPVQLLICGADFNCDTFVDDSDFVSFAQSYNALLCSDGSVPVGCPADLDGDGFVDDEDFVLFAAAYEELICP